MPGMPIALLTWKPMKRNSLRGFAKVRIGKALIVSDVTVHTSHGKRWASMPSKPLLDAAGSAQRDDKGKIKYAFILEWTDRETSDNFSAGVIEAIEREYPGATEGDAA